MHDSNEKLIQIESKRSLFEANKSWYIIFNCIVAIDEKKKIQMKFCFHPYINSYSYTYISSWVLYLLFVIRFTLLHVTNGNTPINEGLFFL